MQQRPAYIYICLYIGLDLSYEISHSYAMYDHWSFGSLISITFSAWGIEPLLVIMIRGSYLKQHFLAVMAHGWSIGSQTFDCKNTCELLVIISSLLIGWSSWCLFHPPYCVIKLVCILSHLVGWSRFLAFWLIDLVSSSCPLIGWSGFWKPAITAPPVSRLVDFVFNVSTLSHWLTKHQ